MEQQNPKNDLEIQTPPKGETPKPSVENPQTKSPIEEAREIRDDIRKEREKFAEERRQFEELRAKQMLEGQSDAGQIKLTPEQQIRAKAEAEANKIVTAFK